MDISAWINHWARWTPSKLALRFEGHELTYAELETNVGQLAGRLRARGIGPGHRVAYLGPNCPELVEALFASSRVGACFVPLNPRMPAAELSVFVGQTRPSLIVTSNDMRETALATRPGDEPAILDFTPGGWIVATASAEPASAARLRDWTRLHRCHPFYVGYDGRAEGSPHHPVRASGECRWHRGDIPRYLCGSDPYLPADVPPSRH